MVNHYIFRFRISKKDPNIKELMVDANSDTEAFKKASKRNVMFDSKGFNYEKSTENENVVFTHHNIKSDWKW